MLRLIVRKLKYDSISSTIRDILHWLQISQRVEFKTCVLVYNCLHNISPSYFTSSMCQPVSVNPSRRYDTYDQLHAVTSSFQPQKQSATALVASQLQDQLCGIRCQHHSVMICRCISQYTQDRTFHHSIRLFFSTLVTVVNCKSGRT